MDIAKFIEVIKMTGAGITGLVAIGGTLVGLGLDPVFRPQMLTAFINHRMEWQTAITDLKSKELDPLKKTAFDTRARAIDSQLQLNRQAVENLKKEKLDREIQLKTDDKLDTLTRSLIQQRHDDVAEKLEEAQRERESLKKEKEAPQ